MLQNNFLVSPDKCFLNLDFLNSPNKPIEQEETVPQEYSLWNAKNDDFGNLGKQDWNIYDPADFHEDLNLQKFDSFTYSQASTQESIIDAGLRSTETQPEIVVESFEEAVNQNQISNPKTNLKSAKPFFPKKHTPKVLDDSNRSPSSPYFDPNSENSSSAYNGCSSVNPKCTSMNKFTCRFDIQIPNESDFRVARKIIGYKGTNMKKIIDMCKLRDVSGKHGVKLRLRGRGSGFKEGPDKKESEDDLHLCVSSKFLEFGNLDLASMLPMYRQNIMAAYEVFKFACRSVGNLLTNIYEEYRQYMKEKHNQEVQLVVKKYENNPAILLSQMHTNGEFY